MNENALLLRVDRFLLRTGMAQSRLGRDALNDPRFYAELVAGRKVGVRAQNVVLGFMRAYEGIANAR